MIKRQGRPNRTLRYLIVRELPLHRCKEVQTQSLHQVAETITMADMQGMQSVEKSNLDGQSLDNKALNRSGLRCVVGQFVGCSLRSIVSDSPFSLIQIY